MQLDENKILDAILSCKVGPAAAEEGSRLVDFWIGECAAEDQRYKTVAVEAGFYFRPDEKTLVIGVIDKISFDDVGLLGNEWKTTKEETRWWDAERWFEEIERGHQVSTYAVALNRGRLLVKNTLSEYEQLLKDVAGVFTPNSWKPSVVSPRILVRAVSKSSPPVMWPDEKGAVIEFNEARINATVNAYRVAAEQIRAARRLNLTPWQLPGRHCVQFLKYVCPSWKVCHGYDHPDSPSFELVQFDTSDPATKNVLDVIDDAEIKALTDDEDFVILSASQLDTWMVCGEKYRQVSGGLGGKEDSENLDVGTVFHAGIAEYNRQMRDGGF